MVTKYSALNVLNLCYLNQLDLNLIIFCSASGFYLRVSQNTKGFPLRFQLHWLILLGKIAINSVLLSFDVFLCSVRCWSIHFWQFFYLSVFNFYFVFIKADHCLLLGWSDSFSIFLRVRIIIVEVNCSLYWKTRQNLLSDVIKKLLGFGLGQIKSKKKTYFKRKSKTMRHFPS